MSVIKNLELSQFTEIVGGLAKATPMTPHQYNVYSSGSRVWVAACSINLR